MKRRYFVRLLAVLGAVIPSRLAFAFPEPDPEEIVVVNGWVLMAADLTGVHSDR